MSTVIRRFSSNLFAPIKVGNMDLAHRVVQPAMTRCRADENGVPKPFVAEYYQQRAQEPGTLIIFEATAIHGTERGQKGTPGVYTQKQVDAWKKIGEAVHAQKSYAFLQLWAMGRKGDAAFLESQGFRQNGASGTTIDGITPHELTTVEAKQYAEWYAAAARRAVHEVGLDGVEIHMGNGYLPEQFLRKQTNDRTDEYGGSIENRARFALEAVEAVVAEVGQERTSLRISPWTPSGSVQPTPESLAEYAYLLGQLQLRFPNLAYVSIIEPRMFSGIGDEFAVPAREGLGVDDWNDFVRLAWEGPLVRSGNLAFHANQIADKDPKALVAIGTWFISNPDIVSRLKSGKELTLFDWTTFYSGDEKGYTDYPNAK